MTTLTGALKWGGQGEHASPPPPPHKKKIMLNVNQMDKVKLVPMKKQAPPPPPPPRGPPLGKS